MHSPYIYKRTKTYKVASMMNGSNVEGDSEGGTSKAIKGGFYLPYL